MVIELDFLVPENYRIEILTAPHFQMSETSSLSRYLALMQQVDSQFLKFTNIRIRRNSEIGWLTTHGTVLFSKSCRSWGSKWSRSSQFAKVKPTLTQLNLT